MYGRIISALWIAGVGLLRLAATAISAEEEHIVPIHPPEKGFFSKQLDYEGIPIKAHKDVADEALFQGRARLAMMLAKLPEVRRRLQEAGAELHVIGRNQVTSDLPEFRHMKGKPFDGEQTVDQRTRGLGGLLTSCGEENLLKLERDRYRGRDICVHEFAHNIQDYGMSDPQRTEVRRQYHRSLAKGLWKGSYAGSSEHEFFAELSMWYWGTHGDLGMEGKHPANGREGLNAYDPEACALLDEFYRGKLAITAAMPEVGRGIRHLFEPTDVVYLRFYIRLSKDWGWTGRPYHPHRMHFMTTENDRFRGPASSHLTVYIEPWNGKLRLGATDMQNADAPHGLTQGPLRGGYNGRLYDSQDVISRR